MIKHFPIAFALNWIKVANGAICRDDKSRYFHIPNDTLSKEAKSAREMPSNWAILKLRIKNYNKKLFPFTKRS